MPLVRKPQGTDSESPPASDVPAALTSSSVETRWAVARQLGTETGHTAQIADALRRESDPRVREALFSALAKSPDPAAIDVLVAFIRAAEAHLRTGALDALSTRSDAVAARLGDLLDDPDPDVRILSCDLARRLPGAEATRQLCELLDREQTINVCAAAVEVLSAVGEPAALPALRAAKARFTQDEFLGYTIDAAIRAIGNESPPGGGPVRE